MGKFGLMAGAAAIAMLAASGAQAATPPEGATNVVNQPAGVQLAQADMPATNAELEARISALEAEVQDSQMRAAEAANNPPAPPTGWWSSTSVSGRMYFDLTNISNKVNGVKSTVATNATSGATNGLAIISARGLPANIGMRREAKSGSCVASITIVSFMAGSRISTAVLASG